MRRFLRSAFNGAAAVSAVMCVTLAVLWLRSFEPATWRVTTGSGCFLFFSVDADATPFLRDANQQSPEHTTFWIYRFLEANGSMTSVQQHFGFKLQAGTADANALNSHPTSMFSFTLLQVPIWPFIIATSAPPLLCLLNLRHLTRRRAQGLCPSCGYDLRATPGRCPECGEASARTQE